jgi:PAS domain S-box-containing protein
VADSAQRAGAAVGRAHARDPWPLIGGVALCLALVAFDAALGRERNFSSAVVIAPFLTALWGTSRHTAAVAALALVTCVISPVWNGGLGSIEYFARVGVVLAGGAFAVIAASARSRLITGRARFALLAQVAELTEGAVTLEETTRRLGEAVVPAFADVCTIDVVSDGRLRRVAARADGRGAAELETVLLRAAADGASAPGAHEVIRGSGSALLADPAEAAVRELARNDADRDALAAAQACSAIVVPLRARGRALGALSLALRAPAPGYEPDDLEFARVLSGRAALALDNAGLFTELETVEARLTAALGSLAEAVTVQDRTGTLVYANDAAAVLLGFESAEEMLSTPPDQIVDRYTSFTEDGRPLRIDDLPGRRVLAGKDPGSLVVRAVNRTTGVERWTIVKATAVLDRDGRPELAVNVVDDITTVKRAEMAQRLLAEAGELLSSALDETQALERLARLLVPQLADWCAIYVADAKGLPLAAVAHADPEKIRFAWEYDERWPVELDAPGGPGAVLRSGRPELLEVTDAMLASGARDSDQLALLRTIGVRQALTVPIVASGEPIGALSLVSAESGRAITDDDVALAAELGRRAGTALDNARMVRERTRIARTLQAGLLPPRLPAIPGWASAALYRPAGRENWVGGDFYDAFRIEDGWMLVVGDVAGRGAEAASLTAMARYTLRATGQSVGSPLAALEQLNRELLERAGTALCTVACAVLKEDDDGAHADVVCAGHPLPLLIREGHVEAVGAWGPLLGAFADERWRTVRVPVAPGDVLVLYTDGVLDAKGPADRFGEDRLRDALTGSATADDAVAAVDRALAAWREGDQDDDTAVLAIQRAPAPVALPAGAR